MSKKSFPLSVALRKTVNGYNLTTFRHDFIAAFVVSLIALPLSMALSIAIGLPPQQGLYTAIAAGIIVPLLGGSIWQVSGPTAAFVVILAPIVSQHGLRGIMWAGIMAGIILIGLGFSRMGRLINYVPYPVTTGFTAGIAIVLSILSLNDFLGLEIAHLDGTFVHKLSLIYNSLPNTNIASFFVGGVTLFLLFTANKIVKAVPSPVIAIPAGTILGIILTHYGYSVDTLGTKFSYVAQNGQIMSGLPPYPPKFLLPTFEKGSLLSIPSLDEFRELLFPAFAIAILAALESLLSATVADSMAGTKHDPNAELSAVGVGNIVSAMFTGIPATGAIARTSALITNGAKTPLASSMHAVFILLYMMLLSKYINYIPMTALAAFLIITAYRMSHYKQFINTVMIAPRSDVIVLIVCFTLTVFIDMVAGVGFGMICAAFLLIKRVTELTKIEVEGNGEGFTATSKKLPKGTMLFRIHGPLFFGTIEKAFDRYQFTHDYINRLIIDISDVPFMDMTGLVAMTSMLTSIAHENRPIHIICTTPEVQAQIEKKIHKEHISKFVHFHNDFKKIDLGR